MAARRRAAAVRDRRGAADAVPRHAAQRSRIRRPVGSAPFAGAFGLSARRRSTLDPEAHRDVRQRLALLRALEDRGAGLARRPRSSRSSSASESPRGVDRSSRPRGRSTTITSTQTASATGATNVQTDGRKPRQRPMRSSGLGVRGVRGPSVRDGTPPPRDRLGRQRPGGGAQARGLLGRGRLPARTRDRRTAPSATRRRAHRRAPARTRARGAPARRPARRSPAAGTARAASARALGAMTWPCVAPTTAPIDESGPSIVARPAGRRARRPAPTAARLPRARAPAGRRCPGSRCARARRARARAHGSSRRTARARRRRGTG